MPDVKQAITALWSTMSKRQKEQSANAQLGKPCRVDLTILRHLALAAMYVPDYTVPKVETADELDWMTSL